MCKVIGLSDNFTVYVMKNNIIPYTCVENAIQYKCHAFIFSLEYRVLLLRLHTSLIMCIRFSLLMTKLNSKQRERESIFCS